MATKALAEQLGLIRRHRPREVAPAAPSCEQKFSFIIVMDFEATCWENGYNKNQNEIIEFPAVLMNLKTGKIEETFHQYVRPTESPTLSKFCREFTGIQQENVDKALTLPVCLAKFSEWVTKISVVYSLNISSCMNNNTLQCAFLTWSDWDLGMCLYRECKRKRISIPPYFNQWIDLKALYKKFYRRTPANLKHSLELQNLVYKGREHSGIDDSLNTAHLAFRMAQEGCVLEISQMIKKQ